MPSRDTRPNATVFPHDIDRPVRVYIDSDGVAWWQLDVTSPYREFRLDPRDTVQKD